jgi:hypothetical protein
VCAESRRALESLALVALLALSGCLPGAGMSGGMREVPDGALAAPGPSESLVVFMRPTEAFACCQASVFELREEASDKLVGIIGPDTKVAYKTEPGKHFFMVVGENASFMRAELAPGKTYYVRIYAYAGQTKTRFDLRPVRPAEFESGWFRRLREAQLIENTSESQAWADDHRDELQGKKAERLRIWLATMDDASAALHPEDGT